MPLPRTSTGLPCSPLGSCRPPLVTPTYLYRLPSRISPFPASSATFGYLFCIANLECVRLLITPPSISYSFFCIPFGIVFCWKGLISPCFRHPPLMSPFKLFISQYLRVLFGYLLCTLPDHVPLTLVRARVSCTFYSFSSVRHVHILIFFPLFR